MLSLLYLVMLIDVHDFFVDIHNRLRIMLTTEIRGNVRTLKVLTTHTIGNRGFWNRSLLLILIRLPVTILSGVNLAKLVEWYAKDFLG